MTIKSLDAQILLPKANEIAKQVHNSRQHDPNQQNLLAQKTQQEQNINRTRIAESHRGEHKKVKEEEKQQSKNRQQKKSPHKEGNNAEENKQKEAKSTTLGYKFDIKI